MHELCHAMRTACTNAHPTLESLTAAKVPNGEQGTTRTHQNYRTAIYPGLSPLSSDRLAWCLRPCSAIGTRAFNHVAPQFVMVIVSASSTFFRFASALTMIRSIWWWSLAWFLRPCSAIGTRAFNHVAPQFDMVIVSASSTFFCFASALTRDYGCCCCCSCCRCCCIIVLIIFCLTKLWRSCCGSGHTKAPNAASRIAVSRTFTRFTNVKPTRFGFLYHGLRLQQAIGCKRLWHFAVAAIAHVRTPTNHSRGESEYDARCHGKIFN